MQTRSWMKLLQRIPSEQHDILVLLTSIGVEINLQRIMRMEDEFLVVRGRLAGTTDTGRVFFIPYSQINYLGFNKDISEAQLQALFDEQVPAGREAQRAAAAPRVMAETRSVVNTAPERPAPSSELPVAAYVPPAPFTPAPVAPAAAASADAGRAGERMAIPRKSGLIARLRARAKMGNSSKSEAGT